MVRNRPRSTGITNAVILQHLQGMRTSLEGRMNRLEKRMNGMEGQMDGMEGRMTKGFEDVQIHLRRIDDALQRIYTHRVSMIGRIERLEETVGMA